MSQQDILDIIKTRPGIEQSELHTFLGRDFNNGSIHRQLAQLLKRKEIERTPAPGKHGTTFRLYPIAATPSIEGLGAGRT